MANRITPEGLNSLRAQLATALRSPDLSDEQINAWAMAVEDGGGRVEVPAALSRYGVPTEITIPADGIAAWGEYDELALYLVANGDVTPVVEPVETDGLDAILVAATSPAGALRVAGAYDAGAVGIDNLPWRDQTIAVVVMRNDAGEYA